MRDKISVLMSVFNEDYEWVISSVKSISEQKTNDFFCIQLIVIIDNPSIVSEIKSHLSSIIFSSNFEFVLLENDKNIGLANSLNKAFEYSDGNYIARLDADDLSKPNRLIKQYHYYKENDFDLIGCGIDRINEVGEYLSTSILSSDSKCLMKDLTYKSICYHPTWFLSRDIFINVGGYRPYPNSQDLDFILRLVTGGYRISNVPEALVKYRLNEKSLSYKHALRQRKCMFHIIKGYQLRLKNKDDLFDESEMLLYIKSNKIINFLHCKSQMILLKSANKKNLILKNFLVMVSALVSPYQFKYIMRLLLSRINYEIFSNWSCRLHWRKSK